MKAKFVSLPGEKTGNSRLDFYAKRGHDEEPPNRCDAVAPPLYGVLIQPQSAASRGKFGQEKTLRRLIGPRLSPMKNGSFYFHILMLVYIQTHAARVTLTSCKQRLMMSLPLPG